MKWIQVPVDCWPKQQQELLLSAQLSRSDKLGSASDQIYMLTNIWGGYVVFDDDKTPDYLKQWMEEEVPTQHLVKIQQFIKAIDAQVGLRQLRNEIVSGPRAHQGEELEPSFLKDMWAIDDHGVPAKQKSDDSTCHPSRNRSIPKLSPTKPNLKDQESSGHSGCADLFLQRQPGSTNIAGSRTCKSMVSARVQKDSKDPVHSPLSKRLNSSDRYSEIMHERFSHADYEPSFAHVKHRHHRPHWPHWSRSSTSPSKRLQKTAIRNTAAKHNHNMGISTPSAPAVSSAVLRGAHDTRSHTELPENATAQHVESSHPEEQNFHSQTPLVDGETDSIEFDTCKQSPLQHYQVDAGQAASLANLHPPSIPTSPVREKSPFHRRALHFVAFWMGCNEQAQIIHELQHPEPSRVRRERERKKAEECVLEEQRRRAKKANGEGGIKKAWKGIKKGLWG
jgi:hypothetical protein